MNAMDEASEDERGRQPRCAVRGRCRAKRCRRKQSQNEAVPWLSLVHTGPSPLPLSCFGCLSGLPLSSVAGMARSKAPTPTAAPGLPADNPFSRKAPPPPAATSQAGPAIAVPPLFPAGYKTPISLLGERCQKAGWDKPDVAPKKLASGLWSAAITLRRRNAKTKEVETVYMRPPAAPASICVEKETALEAK